MGSPKSRARWLRGALVGVTSAAMTVGAHAAGGGGTPSGGALIIALLACATVGTMVGCLRLEGRSGGWPATAIALSAAQFLGHTALMSAGHQHAGNVHTLSTSMAAAHVAAAVILSVVISAAEYLYVMCSSVLCWLRLFAIRALRPAVFLVRQVTNVVFARPVCLTGLGMRAPPWMAVTA
ncbi:MAG: hypothetical protein K0U84_14485 [Actinomycetia bacterium]|nr:hypothetical protein [Actinomycetes bacterium]